MLSFKEYTELQEARKTGRKMGGSKDLLIIAAIVGILGYIGFKSISWLYKKLFSRGKAITLPPTDSEERNFLLSLSLDPSKLKNAATKERAVTLLRDMIDGKLKGGITHKISDDERKKLSMIAVQNILSTSIKNADTRKDTVDIIRLVTEKNMTETEVDEYLEEITLSQVSSFFTGKSLNKLVSDKIKAQVNGIDNEKQRKTALDYLKKYETLAVKHDEVADMTPSAARTFLLRIARKPESVDSGSNKEQVLKLINAIKDGIIPTGKKWELLTRGDQKEKIAGKIRDVLLKTKFKNDDDKRNQYDSMANWIEVLMEGKK